MSSPSQSLRITSLGLAPTDLPTQASQKVKNILSQLGLNFNPDDVDNILNKVNGHIVNEVDPKTGLLVSKTYKVKPETIQAVVDMTNTVVGYIYVEVAV